MTRQRDEPLLGAVVKVALDAAPFHLELVNEALAGAGQLDDLCAELDIAGATPARASAARAPAHAVTGYAAMEEDTGSHPEPPPR